MVTLLVVLYFDTLRKLVEYWVANDVYSYAFLVPMISGVLVWLRRRELERVPKRPSLGLGTAITATGLMMLLAGRLSGTNMVEELSLIVTLAGFTLLLLGPAAFRVLLFPLAYLLAMIPVWEFLTGRLHPYFQLYSATIGVGSLKFLGYPVIRRGVFIDLPNVTLEVAQACSGINYLISVLCIGIPLTYLFIRGWATRLAIIFAAAGIALLSNGARVAIVSLFAYHGVRGVNGDIHGPFALFRSLLISGIGYAILFGLVFRFADKSPVASEAIAGPARSTPAVSGLLRPLPTLIAVGLLTFCLTFGAVHHIDAVPLKAAVRVLPSTLANWHARPVASFSSDLDRLEFDDKLSQNYQASDGTELNVFLGYFTRQYQGRELAGYGIRSLLGRYDRSSYSLNGGALRVKDFLSSEHGDTFHVTYWYALSGRTVTDDHATKLYTAWDSAVRGRTNGAIVMIKTRIAPNDSIEIARKRVGGFVMALLPVVKMYLPE